jgi:hypothetical protein
MQDPDEVTTPGAPLGLEGSAEAQAVHHLAVMLHFYSTQLEQLAVELRRTPITREHRTAIWRRMRDLSGDFGKTTTMVAPWNAPRAHPGVR